MATRLSIERAAALLDVYGGLLTERQRTVASLVYEDDWTLAEVAGHFGTSRAAVADVVARAGHQMEAWEAVLGVVARRETARRVVDDLKNVAGRIGDDHVRRELMRIADGLARAEGVTPAV